MSGTARAIVFGGPGDPLTVETFPLPELKPGEVLVEVTCCTLCGSDLHSFQGHRDVACPTVLGHEIVGRIARLPREEAPCDISGGPLAIGDRVSWSVAVGCGACFYCDQGLPQKCERLFKYGHEPICDAHPLSGGLADYCHLKAGTGIVCLPDELPDEVACPANCATATVAASLRIAGDCRDRIVLIQGAGMLGLTAAAMTRAAGARAVIVADIHPERVERAARFGASAAVNVAAGDEDLRAAIDVASSGRGADIALELSGSSDAAESALPLLRIGGRLILVGAVFPGRPLALSAETIVRKLLRIEGVHNYRPADLVTAIEFLAKHRCRFPFEDLVGARFGLDEATGAFEHAVQTRSFRTAVLPGNGDVK